MTLTVTTASTDRTWQWRGFNINYRSYGDKGIPLLLIHGFGASVGHWRKNLPVLGEQYRCYAIDLIGFGKSAKPTPKVELDYTFDTWADQLQSFCEEVIGEPAFLIANSIGCVAAMQTAVTYPQWVRGVVSLNFSLRLFHEKNLAKSPLHQRWGVPLLQKVLTQTPLGKLFFRQIARPKAIRNVLTHAYHDPVAITDELIEILLTPAKDQGAVDVFLAFISYSQGALPDELLPQLTCPAAVMWGTEDPWEPITLGEPMVRQHPHINFVPLPGVGHCPQDEAPELVNREIMTWLAAQTEI